MLIEGAPRRESNVKTAHKVNRAATTDCFVAIGAASLDGIQLGCRLCG